MSGEKFTQAHGARLLAGESLGLTKRLCSLSLSHTHTHHHSELWLKAALVSFVLTQETEPEGKIRQECSRVCAHN